MSALPTITISGKTYFVDKRLAELRNTKNPNESLTIDDAVEKVQSQISVLAQALDVLLF
jgi:hypothetical protein